MRIAFSTEEWAWLEVEAGSSRHGVTGHADHLTVHAFVTQVEAGGHSRWLGVSVLDEPEADGVGRMILDGDALRFAGMSRSKKNMEFHTQIIERAWLDCSPGPVCYELGIKTAHGDNLRLRDDDWRTGGNAQILALYDTLQARFPSIEFRENVAQ